MGERKDMDHNSQDETFYMLHQEPTENPRPEEDAEGGEIEDQVIDQTEPLVKMFQEAIASLEDV